MSTLSRMVEECILQHNGGEKFFDTLDEKIRSDEGLLHYMIHMLDEEDFDVIIVSGKFGLVFKTFVKHDYPDIKIAFVNGGLRGDGVVTTGDIYELDGKKVVFVDDSYYSGTTARKVAEYVKKCGGEITDTYVFYDGSKELNCNVHSMYRYY